MNAESRGDTADTLPFSGLRVVDFSRLLPGPYATLVMADLGADVIKVEAPKGGDYLRWIPPLKGRMGYGFAALNSGKRSLAVDLKCADGKEAVFTLCAEADIVLESFRPGVMDRLGLGWEHLKAVNPSLIYCAISGYGSDGLYRDRAGHDLNYAALSGLLGMARHRGPLPVQVGDIGGGSLWALVGVLSALLVRGRTGEGAYIDCSMTDGALSFLTAGLAAQLGGDVAVLGGGREALTGAQPCYDVYETADGEGFTLAALEPKFWRNFCEAVQRPDLLSRHVVTGAKADALRAELSALFRTRTRQEWTDAFEGVDACCEPVFNPSEIMNHPLHRSRHTIIEDGSGMRRVRTPLTPHDAPAPGPPPSLGQHSREILESIGYDAASIAALFAAGTVAGE